MFAFAFRSDTHAIFFLFHENSNLQLVNIFYVNVLIRIKKIILNFMSFILLQIGSLKNYYLFHHRHVSKRSVSHNEEHHRTLNSEPEVCSVNHLILIYL